MQKELTKSLEKYLFAIYELSKTNENIKVKDVSSYLKIAGPSTSDAIKTLNKKGFIDYTPYKPIVLTELGKRKIFSIEKRKNILLNFLSNVLELESELSKESIQNMEYFMDERVMDRFVLFLEFMEKCSCKEPKWIKSCKNTLKTGKMSEKCIQCSKNNQKCTSCCAR